MVGKIPDNKLSFIVFVKIGSKGSILCTISDVGIGSNEHVVGLQLVMIFLISLSVTGLNAVNELRYIDMTYIGRE